MQKKPRAKPKVQEGIDVAELASKGEVCGVFFTYTVFIYQIKREELENINFSCQKKAYGEIFIHHLQE